MKKFKVQISDVLLYSRKDADRAKKIVEEMKAMEAKAPGVRAESDEAKEKYWEAHQDLLKANILNYPLAERKRLQQAVWQAESAVKYPLREQSKQWEKLFTELSQLTAELREDVYNYVQGYIKQALELKKATPSGINKLWTSKGEWGSAEKTHIIKQNFRAVEEILQLLFEFRTLILSGGRPIKCRGLSSTIDRLTHDDLVEQVRIFEEQINAIDYSKQVAQEIKPSQFKDLRAEGLI